VTCCGVSAEPKPRAKEVLPNLGLMDQQHRRDKLCELTTGTLEMTEYVIREVSHHQWLVFADRKCIASCADEIEAEKAMREHSAHGIRSSEPMSIAQEQSSPVRAAAP
jgi:hypothetical protein